MTDKILTRLQYDAANATQLSEYWDGVFPSDAPKPPDAQFNLWARLHRENIGVLLDAIDKTAAKYLQANGHMDRSYIIRYCSSCANRVKFGDRRKAA